ncbi:26S proteasome non-ATPase regulatory subunit 12-like [Panonychus citri]|uniref:26S proteasome non-ATPase regulatory subunit 12-like n=1 Tax=Panonychus citri TaxID=50023 RepID=UPI002307B55B|nr:26S proteasome non-ATPase regulatory subunit 12-like [Panonychus citri]
MSNEITFTDTGKLLKMEVDYSSSCDEKIPACKKAAQEGKIDSALEQLLALEKLTRTGADTFSTSRILVAIVDICFDAKDYKLLNDHIIVLTKRRGQIKKAITDMVRECCEFVDKITDKEEKLKLIDTLRSVTAGKIYVEVERARLTHKLAIMREEEGKIEDAANIIGDLQIETFGSMDKREKVELILEQMRLCLAKKDFIKAQILSKKIHTKFFSDEKVQDLKMKYYELMIKIDQQEGNYLNICKHYRAVFDTPIVKQDPQKNHEVLKNIVLYIVLSPFDNEQSDLIHRIKVEKGLEELPNYGEVLKFFTTTELINWRLFIQGFEDILRSGTEGCPATDVYGFSELGKKRWKDLKSRVVEHNIRIMAKYYKRIRLNRMAELLDLSIVETEEILSNLVCNKTIWSKVDRLEGIVNFEAHKDPNEVLNDWSHNISALMNLVCKADHLINKEEMIHQHLNVSKMEA